MVQRSDVAKRSVYVRGFSADVPSTEDELRKVMGQFGGVVSVVVVATDSDVYALVEFGTVESALSALRHPSPLTLHAHTLTVKPRLLKTNKIPKRTVMQGRRKRLSVSMAMGEGASVEVREGGKEEVVGGIRLTSEAVAALSDAHSVRPLLPPCSQHIFSVSPGGPADGDTCLSLSPWQLHCRGPTVVGMATAGQVLPIPAFMCCHSIWSPVFWSRHSVV